jgi:hypothetical protein
MLDYIKAFKFGCTVFHEMNANDVKWKKERELTRCRNSKAVRVNSYALGAVVSLVYSYEVVSKLKHVVPQAACSKRCKAITPQNSKK